jgi:hypothetical protein
MVQNIINSSGGFRQINFDLFSLEMTSPPSFNTSYIDQSFSRFPQFLPAFWSMHFLAAQV